MRVRPVVPLALPLVTLLLAAGCGTQPETPAAKPRSGPPPVAVEVAAAERRDLALGLDATGSIEAAAVAQVTARVSGVVDRVAFVDGQRVAAGDVLVEIDADRYRLLRDAAQADRTRAEAELADAEGLLQRRETAVARSPGLLSNDELVKLRNGIAVARAELARAAAAMARAELDLRDAHVTAPCAGQIENRAVQPGSWVQPGLRLATIVQRDPVQVRLLLPEPDARRVRPGDAATFIISNEPRRLRGSVRAVAAAADSTTRTVTVLCEVHAEDAPLLTPGGFVRAELAAQPRPGAVVVPQTAVKVGEKGARVFVVEGDPPRAGERPVRTGLRTADGGIEIVEGLPAGTSVIRTGVDQVRDGAAVLVR